MNRTAFVRAAGVLLAATAIPVALAGGASASTSPSSTYSGQVAIGTALKIAGPSVHGAAPAAVTTSATAAASSTPAASDTSTATPPGAVVIETESHQAATVTDTSVAVLGTKVAGPTLLANTGPKHVGDEAGLALLLIALGAMLVCGPRLWDSAQRAAARTH